ncbi:metacaspase type II MCP1 [Gracilaria domingensis]|nr:metacaspase type II MCP1 [Gracilaria domingensis]
MSVPGFFVRMFRRLFGGLVSYFHGFASALLSRGSLESTTGKYAVIIGINYVNNPRAALMGCCNDARIMYDIVRSKGFEEDNIKMLIDDDDGYDLPNHKNVKKALNWLCSDRKAGDVIFMHFSGHGTQIPADDDDIEGDNLDEAIVLEELFLMADDDLKQFFSKLPHGSKATVVTDCCHSGTMLDGTQIAIEGSKDDYSVSPQPESDILLNVLGGSRGGQVAQSARSLPISTICDVMSQKLGKPVEPTGSGVKGAMAEAYGGTAGKLMMKYAVQEIKKQERHSANPAFGLLGSVLSRNTLAFECNLLDYGDGNPVSSPQSGSVDAIVGSLPRDGSEGVPSSGYPLSLREGSDGATQHSLPESENPVSALAAALKDIGITAQTDPDAPGYTPMHKAMAPDVCTLITGCQAHETSADVQPPNGKAFGALTKTLATIYERNPKLSHYDLVSQVRRELSNGSFTQNPCLECSELRAREIFIC